MNFYQIILIILFIIFFSFGVVFICIFIIGCIYSLFIFEYKKYFYTKRKNIKNKLREWKTLYLKFKLKKTIFLVDLKKKIKNKFKKNIKVTTKIK